MTQYRLLTQSGTKSVFIHPQDVGKRLTFSVTTLPKKVSGVQLNNRLVRVKSTRSEDPRGPDCKDCTSVLEPLSVELVLSGSINSQMHISAMREDVITAINAKFDELFKVGVAPIDATNIEFHAAVTGTPG